MHGMKNLKFYVLIRDLFNDDVNCDHIPYSFE